MDIQAIFLCYRKELTDFLRDRRTIVSLIVLPLSIQPLTMVGMDQYIKRSERQAREQKLRIALKAEAQIGGLAISLDQTGSQVRTSADPRRAVESKEADIGIEIAAGDQRPVVKVYSDRSEMMSQIMTSRIRQALDRVRDERVQSELQRLGVNDGILKPFSVENVNVAPPRKMGGLLLGNLLGLMLVIFMLNGGMYPTIDMTAGEKERRTMEMLLSAPTGREEIVLGKILATITAELVTAMLILASFAGSFYLGGVIGGSGPLGQLMKMPVDALSLTLAAISVLPMAVFGAATITAVASVAKSSREATSYLTPLVLVALSLAVLNFLPGLQSRFTVALIPVANFCRLIKDLLQGEWTWAAFGLTLLANCVYAAIAFAAAVHNFKNESMLFRL